MAPKKKSGAAKKDEVIKAEGEAKGPEAQQKEDVDSKRKADEALAEPVHKSAKLEDGASASAESGEKEQDSPKDKRPAITEPVTFPPATSTLNVVSGMGGRLLMTLSEGGMQYLVAGARADVGVKAGRYMFEARVIEALVPTDTPAAQSRAPKPRQVLRIGFSAAGSQLVLGSDEQHVCFDAEGFFYAGRKKSATAQRLKRDEVLGVVLNLDPRSPNANTLSLFRNGERISEPQPIPESLHGKALFPHISFRSITLQVYAGPCPERPLPFKCRSIGGAAKADVEVAESLRSGKGKCELVLPVGYPDEGTFEWLDGFLERHPGYVELSDRKILEWAAISGLWKPKALGNQVRSRDKPEFNFGLQGMDDFSVQRVLRNVAPLVPRNYVVMEVRANLVGAERRALLKQFSPASFRRTARVVMGEPEEEFKAAKLEKLRLEKQEKADAAWKVQQGDKQRQRQLQRTAKQMAGLRKTAEKSRSKAQEEVRKKAEEANTASVAKEEAKEEDGVGKADTTEAAEAGKEAGVAAEKEEAKKEEENEDVKEAGNEAGVGVKKEDVKEEEKDDKMEEDLEPPRVELTDEEKQMWFKPLDAGCTDLSSAAFKQSFASFSLPKEEEGFDEISYEWQGAEASRDYFRAKVLEKKRILRIDDLQPGQWFRDKHKEFTKLFSDWQAKQKAFKATVALRKKEGKDIEELEREIDDPDIYTVADVCDTGGGAPLFKSFELEDWGLLQLRYEMRFLQAAFKKDVDDPDRPGVPHSHLAFYYNKYFRRQMIPKNFGLTSIPEMLEFVQDTVVFNDDDVLVAVSSEEVVEVAALLRLTEEKRRDRLRQVEAGDESARLKFTVAALHPSTGPAPSLAIAAPRAPGLPQPVPAGVVRPQAWSPSASASAWPQWSGGGQHWGW